MTTIAWPTKMRDRVIFRGPRDFLEEFESRRWVLWLGSAISVATPTLLPTAVGFVGALTDVLTERLAEPERQATVRAALRKLDLPGVHMPFEAVVGQVGLHIDRLPVAALQLLFRRAALEQANTNHIIAARLLRQERLIQRLVTTNFDEALEPLVPSIWHLNPEDVDETASTGAVVKLHGSIGAPERLAVNPDALQARADSVPWQRALFEIVAGQNLLFVGYGFGDSVDVLPVLTEALRYGTTIYAAIHPPTQTQHERHVLEQMGANLIHHDLASSSQNLLWVIGDHLGLLRTNELPSEWPTQSALSQKARHAVNSAVQALDVTPSQILRAIGALSYWIDEGEDALKLFGSASNSDRSQELHLLAAALEHARRYRPAVRLFDELLRRERAQQRPDALQLLNWLAGAGFCAAQGGRLRLAESYFSEAERVVRRSGIDWRKIDPNVADQYLRGTASHHVHMALSVWNPKTRAARVRRAEELLQTLQFLNLPLRLRPLLDMAWARVALTHGDRQLAAALYLRAKQQIDVWGDEQQVIVVERRLAAVGIPNRERLVDLARSRRARGHWFEWFKLTATLIGLRGYEGSPLTAATRAAFLWLWDLAKDSFLMSPWEPKRQ